MQNRYVGDTGDFGKYLLLKYLCRDDFQLGVNWCLVDDEEQNNDGRHIDYLQNESGVYFESDSDLFYKLKEIVMSQRRDVFHVEKQGVLPSSTIFFSKIIPNYTDRFNWHDNSLEHLKNSDIIFYDPDNGIETQSYGKLHPKAVKYVYFDEIRDAYRNKKSIIIYQHTNRRQKVEAQINKRIDQLSKCLRISDKSIGIVYSGQGTSRFYLIVKHSEHVKEINRNLKLIEEKKAHQILKIYR